jgi:hypothetical protein
LKISTFISLLTRTDKPAPPAEILRFEAAIGTPLPTDYREFLSRANGGFLPSGRGGNDPSFRGSRFVTIAHVFGLRKEPHFSLFDHLENLGVPLPPGLVAIMDDGNGNLICLSINEPTYGHVYIRDGGDIYHITGWLAAFISGLRFWHESFTEQ